MGERQLPLNDDAARRRLERIADPTVRNLIQSVLGAAIVQLLHPVGMPDQEWDRRLPAAPFDLEYLVRILEIALGDKELVTRILAGESPESAGGWDLSGA